MNSSLSCALPDLELTLPRGCKQEHISADSSPMPFPQIVLQGQINNETARWEITLKHLSPPNHRICTRHTWVNAEMLRTFSNPERTLGILMPAQDN